MKTDEFIKILNKYSSGRATIEEKILVEEYFDKKHSSYNYTEQFSPKIESDVYLRIEDSIMDTKVIKPFHRFAYRALVAASVLLVVGLFMFIGHKPELNTTVVKTNYGEKREVLLPDGSLVILNSDSSLEFPEVFNEDFREVILTGEGFFKVQRDSTKPFLVETEGLTTEVLGTSFNINSFSEKDSITVSVVTGKVRVGNSNELKEILLPNHQLHYHKTTHGYRKSLDESLIDMAWTSNTIYLNNITLKEALSMLEKWFDVYIEIQDSALGQKRIVGKYHDNNLRTVLESLSFLLNIEFKEISPSNYIVVPKK
ncbi:FecR family protein [Zobellia roscoffensis]|uniref:FecR family protein n=1 Tax=Zobellia roscoffensis TaxID=2779508 RepID=UPI00188B2155|nr:FecR domain-containing protein [Zobellia roscoffensis]